MLESFGKCLRLCPAGCLAAALIVCASSTAHAQFGDVSGEASLVALWELNEAAGSGTVTDTSATYNGTVFTGTTLGAPSAMTTLGTAANFNGSSGKIDVAYAAALNTPDYTIEAWAQVAPGSSGFRSPLTSRDSTPADEGYIFYAASNDNWEHWNGNGPASGSPSGSWDIVTGPGVLDSQWVHLAGTHNDTSGVKTFYVNGHPVGSQTVNFVPNDASELRIGAGATGTPGSFFFNGNVDNVAVLNTALAHQNISDHFNARSNYATRVATDAPVAYWRLGEQAGTSAYNAMDVTSHTGSFSSTFGLRQSTIGLANDIDTAKLFNASATTRVTVPYSAALNPTGSFSVEAWARVDGGTNTFRSVLTSREGSTPEGFILYAADDDTWEFWTGNGSTWNVSDGLALTGDWVHLVGTYDADTMTQEFFIDGTMVDSDDNITFQANTLNDLFIGAGDDDGLDFFFNGLIDDVAIYDFVLSDLTIQEHFQTGISGNLVLTTPAAVPEPSSLALFCAIGAILLLWHRRHVKSRQA